MIGVIGAMHIEVETIKSLMENKTAEKIGGVEFVKGTLHGREIVIAVCGIGKVAAAMCTQIMILKYSPDVIINTGVAGSLSDGLSVCDVAVSRDVVQHDMDTSPLGDPIGLISGINIVNIPASEQLCTSVLSAAADCGIKALPGTIASGDVFVAEREKKEYIKKNFGAIACEMEGASIGQVCYVNSVPFVVIRAISDGGDEDAAMSYDKFVIKASENSVKLLLRLFETI